MLSVSQLTQCFWTNRRQMAICLTLWSLLGVDGSFLTHGSEDDNVYYDVISG